MFIERIQRIRSAFLLAACLTAAVTPQAAQAQNGSSQVALISLSGYDEIAADVAFVGELIGQPQLAEQMEGLTMFFAGGLNGLDKAQPIGVAVYADGPNLSVVGLLPVADVDQFLSGITALQATTEDGGDGVLEIHIAAAGQTVYAKPMGGWTAIAQEKSQLAAAPADPAAVVGGLAKDYDLGARIFVQNIPSEIRQMAIGGLRSGIEEGLAQDPDESDEAYELRKNITVAQIEQFEQVLEEMDQLTIGWSLSSKESRTYLDFTFTAVPGSDLARQCATYGDAKTDYAGFHQPDAAGMMVFAAEMSERDVEQALSAMSGIREAMMKQIEEEADLPDEKAREIVKSAVGDMFDAFVETMKAGKFDGGAVMNLKPDALTVVAGGFCAAPEKVKDGLKKLEALAENEPDFPGIHWDADSHRGVSFHTMSAPIQGEEQEAIALFGNEVEVAIGTGADSVFLAFGRNALAECKRVMDTSSAAPGKTIAPFELSVSLGQVLETVSALNDDPNVATMADAIKSDGQGRDHIRITAKAIELGVKYHIEVEEGVLRAIGKAIEMNRNGES